MKEKDELDFLKKLELAEQADKTIVLYEDEKEKGIFAHMNQNPFPDILPDRGTEDELNEAADKAGLIGVRIFIHKCWECEPIDLDDKPDF